MNAKSIKGKSFEEIQSALDQSMSDGFRPTLAIVFLSIRQNREAISAILDERGIAIYGATTHGEFIDEELSKESIVILLLDMNRANFRVLYDEYPGKNYRDITRAMAQKTLETFKNPAFLIACSNVETDAEQLLFGFEDIIGTQVNVFGCMAGDDLSFSEQYVFTNGRSSNSGIVARRRQPD